jgi:mono/diheme cytochrome c family protein
MSDEIKSSQPEQTELQPAVERSTDVSSKMPYVVLVLTLILIFWGGLTFDQHGGWFARQVYGPYTSTDQLDMYQPKSGAAAAMARGKVVYEQVCGLCHGVDGAGKPNQAPPLAGSEWVNSKGFNRLARIPITGLNGSLQVEGKDWNLSMAAMGAALSDSDLAAVLSYVRSSWGNKASAVGADDVHAIRTAMGGHAAPMSGDQMKALPE